MDYGVLKQAVSGQDIVYVNLAGDLDNMAENIIKAIKAEYNPPFTSMILHA